MIFATFNICWWNSAINKWLSELFIQNKIDILAVQELKTENIKIPLELSKLNIYLNPVKHHWTWVISKIKPIEVKYTLWHTVFDQEWRFIQLEFENYFFINVYMPHWWRKKQNLDYKIEVYNHLINYISKLNKPIILSWDFNIAHTENDLAKVKENKNNIMFTIDERKKIDSILELWLIDTIRLFNKEKVFTWWLRAFNAKERNIWWRLDYFFISDTLVNKVKNCYTINSNISDHCPLIMEINI